MDRKTQHLLVVSFIALTAFFVVAFWSFYAHDWPAAGTSFGDVRNLCGPLGAALAHGLFGLFGRFFAWIAPLFLMVLAFGVAAERARSAAKLLAKTFAITVLMTAFFALVPPTQQSGLLTGSLGRGIAGVVSAVIGEIGGTILLITCLLLVLLTEVGSFGRVGASAAKGVAIHKPPLGRWAGALSAALHRRLEVFEAWRAERAERRAAQHAEAAEYDETIMDVDPGQQLERRASATTNLGPDDAPWLQVDFGESPAASGAPASAPSPQRRTEPSASPPRKKPSRVPLTATGMPLERAALPPLSILQTGSAESYGYSAEQLKSWSDVLEDKLSVYGIDGKVTAVNHGPMVTTFEFEPAPGVKIKDIVSRADDLALAMRARSLRLIAPIPGRAVVGIEIPNPEQETVYFHDVLKEIPDRLRYSGIMIALGSDAHGKPFNMNLCSAPHLLMAGTTGSGKSVALNTFLASILFQYRPSDVQLLLIDPKMVEMSLFNGIPHLLHPVITDPRDAVRVFNYAILEMGRRNQLLRKHGVKNIESFNSKIGLGKIDTEDDEPVEKLPYIVLVVDEMADLVLTKGVDFEAMLSRLSNMARAVGIHMIVATQRPSVDVIDGKTKANFPTRIAFRVATKVDSRTILDTMGAEKLLGNGDMLYVDAKHPEALRLHGSWISEDELEELVAHWKQFEYEESELELYAETTGGIAAEDRDSFFDDARQVVLQFKQGSTSLLQRKLHVGYARAARILDQLESAGIVGPPEGSKPREVLIAEDAPSSASSDL
jgi:S-DNA-T family DNA segregation ATPase FtsK/SpoIIIE